MADTQEVIREKQAGTTPGGKQVSREKTSVVSHEQEKFVAVWSMNRFVFYVFSLIETLLVFRFLLKILGANPGSPFVSFIYTLSSIFESPFRGIFRSASAEGIEVRSIFEPSTLVALLVYFVVAAGITELIRIMTATNDES